MCPGHCTVTVCRMPPSITVVLKPRKGPWGGHGRWSHSEGAPSVYSICDSPYKTKHFFSDKLSALVVEVARARGSHHFRARATSATRALTFTRDKSVLSGASVTPRVRGPRLPWELKYIIPCCPGAGPLSPLKNTTVSLTMPLDSSAPSTSPGRRRHCPSSRQKTTARLLCGSRRNRSR